MHLLPALTAQSSKCTAGAITVVEVIITDGAEAIITVGDIITIGEICLGAAELPVWVRPEIEYFRHPQVWALQCVFRS